MKAVTFSAYPSIRPNEQVQKQAQTTTCLSEPFSKYHPNSWFLQWASEQKFEDLAHTEEA